MHKAIYYMGLVLVVAALFSSIDAAAATGAPTHRGAFSVTHSARWRSPQTFLYGKTLVAKAWVDGHRFRHRIQLAVSVPECQLWVRDRGVLVHFSWCHARFVVHAFNLAGGRKRIQLRYRVE